MRSFSLTWSSEVEEDEAVVMVTTVHEAVKAAWAQLPDLSFIVPAPEIRPFGDWYLQGEPPEEDYASFAWYQAQAADRDTGEVYAGVFLDLVVHEPWQQEAPHYDLSLLHQRLIDAEGRPLLGLAARGRAAVFSTHATGMLVDKWQRLALLRRLTAHYLGQALAIPISRERQRAHGPQPCAMRPATTLPMLIALTEQETQAQVLYCELCQEEIGRRLVGSHLGHN